jgi:dTDP-4-amino-4,6-dideoxygalactose transaminase
MQVARGEGLTVIEDCCLALGSTYGVRKVGTFGVAGYFSFQWNKPYTTGLGGMAVFQDDALADKVAEIRRRELVEPGAREVMMLAAQLAVYRACIYPKTTALAQDVFRWLTRKGLVVGSSATGEFRPAMEADFFKNMSATQARVGTGHLKRLDRSVKHRRRMARLYDELLGQRGWPVPRLPDTIDPVLVRYPVRVRDKQRALETAARHYVELGSWFECPLHPIETPMEAYDYHTGMCPVSEQLCTEVVNLPLHPRANEKTVRQSVEFVVGIGPAEDVS